MRIVLWEKNRDFTAFDALMDDGKVSIRQKKIMDVFDDVEFFSYEVKQRASNTLL